MPDGFSLVQDGPRPGVYWLGDGTPPQWLCYPLQVRALTHDGQGGNWGRLLVWRDRQGLLHHWAMPAELACSDGPELIRALTRGGLLISTSRSARQRLCTYITFGGGTHFIRCTARTGWQNEVFVLPDRIIGGPDSDTLCLQSEDDDSLTLRTAGSLDAWKQQVAALAIGNSRLVFALSLAFAGPLAAQAREAGGFHLEGASSCGKSTALELAASVWGPPGRVVSQWRSTLNGLEGLCARRNDLVLILDELAQVDPREAGEAAYLIANGQGKTRALKEGGLRPALHWRVLLLSAGEISLGEHMRSAGRACRAGQDIRLIDIPADAGRGHGLFENLHGCQNGDHLSRQLRERLAEQHGFAGRAFLERLVCERADVGVALNRAREAFVHAHAPASASGQALRAAARFALCGFAGDLASRWGLTGWPDGLASQTAGTLYRAWLQQRGGGDDRELHDALATIRLFLEQHGESRFTCWDHQPAGPPTYNRAGFRRTDQTGTWYYLFTQVFQKELCATLPASRIARAMSERGWLKRQTDDRYTCKVRLPGMGRSSTNVYLVTPKIWDA